MSSNSNGSGFEACIEALLKMKFKEVKSQHKTGWAGLFGQDITVDFACDESFVVEVKFQAVGGSVEQKLVYAIEQIKQCHQLPTILVIGGAGFSRGCLDYALSQSGGSLLSVQSVDQFVSTISKGGAWTAL